MVQFQLGGEAESATARLSRSIAAHIARGNKPDFEAARAKFQELEAAVSAMEPWDMTEEQIESLVRENCGRGGR
jgi:hypothetical protein